MTTRSKRPRLRAANPRRSAVTNVTPVRSPRKTFPTSAWTSIPVIDARGKARRSSSVACPSPQPTSRIVPASVQARTALAQVLLAEGTADAALIRAELDQALELTERTGFLSYQPQIHLRLSELARSTGDETAAAQEFDLAYRQFGAIGADGWLKDMTAAR